jgi:uncharacterized membrane protein
MNILEWSIADYCLFITCLIIPKLGLSVIIGLFITCNIEYLQHDYNNYPIDFTNKFDNWIGFNFGYHTKHHQKNEIKHSVDTEFYIGLFSMYVWLILCLVLYPIMLSNPLKSNNSGVYIYGFLQKYSKLQRS